MAGMGLTTYPNQREVNKSDEDIINEKTKIDNEAYNKANALKNKSNQNSVWQNPTTPTVSGVSALDKIMGSYRDRHHFDKDNWYTNAAPELAKEQKAKKAAEEASKESAPEKASEDLNPWDVSASYNNLGDKLSGKSNSESSEEEKDTYKSGNPNGGNLKVDINSKPEDGMGRLDKESKKSTEESTPAKEEPTSAPTTTAPVSKPKAKSSGSRRNPDLENSGKTKEWYENLANSSYANDKKYEADMQAYNKMKSDEIAKNGYYTDSQGVKVYAKAMSDTPKGKKNA